MRQGRRKDAQALRLSLFERHLTARHLKAHLKQLKDFDDVEAESATLDRAARLVDARIGEIDADLYELLNPAASMLEGKHPLASVLLRRRLIDVALQKATSTRYRHAVRHVREIESQQSDITDYGRHESHADFIAWLRREHPRKSGFWSLLAA